MSNANPSPIQLVLVDRQAPLVRAWERAFGEYPEVTVVQGDFFARPADAMVSPANSFGIMDGGLDLAYDHVNAPARIPSAAQIHAIHRALRTS